MQDFRSTTKMQRWWSNRGDGSVMLAKAFCFAVVLCVVVQMQRGSGNEPVHRRVQAVHRSNHMNNEDVPSNPSIPEASITVDALERSLYQYQTDETQKANSGCDICEAPPVDLSPRDAYPVLAIVIVTYRRCVSTSINLQYQQSYLTAPTIPFCYHIYLFVLCVCTCLCLLFTARRHDMLERLLHSIALQASTAFSFEVLVVDNGCLSETNTIVHRRFQGIHYIPRCSNIGYARANNLGAERASPSTKWLLFLNDDTQLYSGFLHNSMLMQQLFEEGLNRPIGAIGCKIIAPNGQLMEAGSTVYSNGYTDNYGRRDLPNNPEYSFTRYKKQNKFHYCTALACQPI